MTDGRWKVRGGGILWAMMVCYGRNIYLAITEARLLNGVWAKWMDWAGRDECGIESGSPIYS